MPILPNIMDFEASGLGEASYPIEVGFCLGNGERYCTLIRPIDAWRHWDKQAEQLHGIPRQLLQDKGQDVVVVALELNRRLDGEVLYSDGWVVDKTWLNQIYAIAGMAPSFELRAIEHIQSECQYLCWDRVRKSVIRDASERRHRASTDAFIVQQVFAQTQRQCLAQSSVTALTGTAL